LPFLGKKGGGRSGERDQFMMAKHLNLSASLADNAAFFIPNSSKVPLATY